MKNRFFRKLQAAAAVLLFVFLTGLSFAGVAEDLAAGKPLRDVISDSLNYGVTVNALVADLVAAEVNGKDIICSLFSAGAEKFEVIAAALDNGLDSNDVAQWAYDCGASQSDIQMGFSMADESLPSGMVFQQSNEFEDSAKDYLYNPPSPSK